MIVPLLTALARPVPQGAGSGAPAYELHLVPHAAPIIALACFLGLLAIACWLELRKCSCDHRKPDVRRPTFKR